MRINGGREDADYGTGEGAGHGAGEDADYWTKEDMNEVDDEDELDEEEEDAEGEGPRHHQCCHKGGQGKEAVIKKALAMLRQQFKWHAGNFDPMLLQRLPWL